MGNVAYVGAWDGYEYAINTQTGALIWKTNTGVTTDPGCNPSTNGITSSAAVVNGVVYVGGGGPYFYALNASTGAVLWQTYTGDNSQAGAHYNWSSPLIVGNNAYVGIASNCDNPLVQGQLLEIPISGPQQGQVVATHNFVPNGQVGGGIWTSPAYDPATSTIFVSTGTLAGYTQTESQAIVALNATTLATVGVWQLPFGASVADSDWGTTPTLTTDAAGDQLLSVANKNGILYTFNRNNLSAGPVWQHQIAIGGNCPTCGDGSHRFRHLRERHAVLRRRPHRDQRARVRRVDHRLRPRHRERAVDQADRLADPRLARLRERNDRAVRGVHLRGGQRRQRPAAVLVRAAGQHLRRRLRGLRTVLRPDARRPAARLRRRRGDDTARGPELPRRVHLPGHSRPG